MRDAPCTMAARMPPETTPSSESTLGRVAEEVAPDVLAKLPEGVVSLGERIAEGGMGEVRRGTQHRLRREVAVKRARPGRGVEGAMLREARIAAALSHPNILPIHSVSRDGDEPLIVMKRVDGRVFSEVLRDQREGLGDATRSSRPSAAGHEDRWVAPVQVLIDVARAVHFAHSRGVLHLDIKPDNIMVGAHGEVVLLDWGLATAFDGQLAPPFLRSRHSVEGVCGTPGYLSPEQAEGQGARFVPATDVYQLGAVLHEILTGAPPHTGPVVMALLSAHRADPPRYDEGVPPELGAIAARALAREPSDRYPDADAFRLALEGFLAHRPALALARRGDALLSGLEATLPHGPGAQVALSLDALERETAFEVQLDACRFAYQQALRLWPASPDARRGLCRLSELALARAEARLDVPAARAALDDHPASTEALVERVRAVEEAARADHTRLEALRALSADEDVDTHRRVRVGLALGGGLVWLAWNLLAGLLDRRGVLPLDHTTLIANVVLAATSFGLFLGLGGHRALFGTAFNRRATTLVLATFAQTFVLWTGAALLGVPAKSAAALAGAAYVLAALSVAAILDSRTWWVGLLMLLPALGAALSPSYVFEWTALLGPIGGAGLALMWWRPQERGTAS